MGNFSCERKRALVKTAPKTIEKTQQTQMP